MDQTAKDLLLEKARGHLADTRELLSRKISHTRALLSDNAEELRALDADSEEIRMIQTALIGRGKITLEELEKLLPSPYFTRCDIRFDDEPDTHSYYFAKFSFSDDSIYSWTTPIAGVRYEEPGPISYLTPEDGLRHGTLLRKDQYMIVDGKIIFLATESLEAARELIHQEYLSAKKGSFVLPEIVAQMEKAQDQVIRAAHAGPFVISGPAGSGKTTLALHRVAFLTQSPETSRLYPGRSLIVFVQDAGTKDYFSHLLPELGIHTVRITTFEEWGFEMLRLEDMSFVTRPGSDEDKRDRYEFAKLQALGHSLPRFQKGKEFSFLEKVYESRFNPEQTALFQRQKERRELDRYDLTLLLQALGEREGGFPYMQEQSVRLKTTGEMRLKSTRMLREYPLMLIDEFQNYLPQQLRLFGLALKKSPGSILYVGDLAQQTRFGTIQKWEDIDATIHPERTVRLEKVYRNTRPILEYIQRLGYAVEAPEGLKDGSAVVEVSHIKPEEELVYIHEQKAKNPQSSIGVLSKDPDYLIPHRTAFADLPQVRCMGIREAQGVEFDIVILVGLDSFATRPQDESGYEKERGHIDRDLLYVALTRAMRELHVLGQLDGVKQSL